MRLLALLLASVGTVLALPGAALTALGLKLAGSRPKRSSDLADVTIYYADEETADRLTHMAEMGAVGFWDPRSEWRTKN